MSVHLADLSAYCSVCVAKIGMSLATGASLALNGRWMMKALLAISGCLLVTVSLAAGCGDSVENAITCADVCKRYKDCFDSDYDVANCTNQCQSDANSNNDKEKRLRDCDSCIEDRSCSGAVFNCATECVGVIPS